jgi:Bacterial Ig-like domain (group 2).
MPFRDFPRAGLVRLASALLASAALTAAAGCTTQPAKLELEPKEHTFNGIGENLWFKALPKAENGKPFPKLQADVRWTSSDPGIVSIDAHGRAQAVGAGQAVLTATLGTLKYDARVEVRSEGRIEIEGGEITLTLSVDEFGDPVREPVTVKAAVFDTLGRKYEGRKPVLRCADENVCRTSNDKVVPVEPGETRLIASSGSASAEIPVKVVSDGKKPPRKKSRGNSITF